MSEKGRFPVFDEIDHSVPEHSYLGQLVAGGFAGFLVIACLILLL